MSTEIALRCNEFEHQLWQCLWWSPCDYIDYISKK
jgi:hypothetical protein